MSLVDRWQRPRRSRRNTASLHSNTTRIRTSSQRTSSRSYNLPTTRSRTRRRQPRRRRQEKAATVNTVPTLVPTMLQAQVLREYSQQQKRQQQQQQQQRRTANQYQSHSEHTRNEARRQYENPSSQTPNSAIRVIPAAQAPPPSAQKGVVAHCVRQENAGPNNNAEKMKTQEAKTKAPPKTSRDESTADEYTTRAAEAAMSDFWNGGGKNFRSSSAASIPRPADVLLKCSKRALRADRIFHENATYEAFRAAFERRGYGDAAPLGPLRRIGAQHCPCSSFRIHGQIRAESVAPYEAVGVVCSALLSGTRDRSWISSSCVAAMHAKNNLSPGTHYDFRARTTAGWGPTLRLLLSAHHPWCPRHMVRDGKLSITALCILDGQRRQIMAPKLKE